MTKPKLNFYQLTPDEKGSVIGVVNRDICIAEIARLTGMPEFLVRADIQQKVIDYLKNMSPNEIEKVIQSVRNCAE